MKKDIKFSVLHIEEDIWTSLFRDTFTFLMLALCVWISKESTVWTVISVAMFVTGVACQRYWQSLFSGLGTEAKYFKTKADLQEWVDGL